MPSMRPSNRVFASPPLDAIGLNLLHPWANRLSAARFAVAGREVDVARAGARAMYDPDHPGVPIHGLRSDAWEELGGGRGFRLAFGEAEPELLAAFPFPHEIVVEVAVAGATTTVTTTVTPTGDVAVPISYGFHPYFTFAGVPRAAWVLELPEPTAALGARSYDGPVASVADGTTLAVADGAGARAAVAFLAGFPVAQVYAPPAEDLVAIEPMTAPVDALVSGDGLTLVAPGERHVTRFAIARTPS